MTAMKKEPGQAFVDRCMARLTDRLQELAGKELDDASIGSFFASVSTVVKGHMPKTILSRAALAQSAGLRVGQIYQADRLSRIAYRIICNWHFIDAGMPIPEWDGSVTDVSLSILGVIRQRFNKRGIRVFDYFVRVKSGLPAGCLFETTLSEPMLIRFFSSSTGLSREDPPAEDFSGMLVRASVSFTDGAFRVHEIDCTQTQRENNKKLEIARADPTKCKRNVMCNTCSKTVYECPLAVWFPEKAILK